MYQNRILIVDDQSFNIEAIKIVLKYRLGIDSDHICDTALSGADAIDLIHTSVEETNTCIYNLILLDCNMPFMDGYETA